MNHFRLRLLSFLSSLVVLSLLALPALAATERRVALVIGNTRYEYSKPLRNPGNDARAMAEALRRVGFELVDGKPLLDLNKQDTEKAIQRFGSAMKGADVALFFYSGHGTQVDGQNYIVPVDAEVETKSDVRLSLVLADYILKDMEKAKTKTNIIILDACRTNPFGEKGFRDASSGLAQMNAPRGSYIAYAAAPGRTASDGAGNNSPYTAALVKNIVVPGLRLEDVFMRTVDDVYKSTLGEQVPWTSTNLRGIFYFTPPATATAQQPTPSVDPEVVYWQSVANSNNLASFEAYLSKYPQGQFASLAKVKISELKPKPQAQVAPAPSSVQPTATTPAASNPSSPKVGDIWTEPVTGMKFVWVPGGTYEMGCGSWTKGHKYFEPFDCPVRRVAVKGFWISQFEVTQKQWKTVMKEIGPQSTVGDNHPVGSVSWYDALEFAKNLEKEGSGKFRLPSVAEWEYAARSGGKKEIFSGGNNPEVVGWYRLKAVGKYENTTYPVGQKAPNGLGLYDMSGNVAEWTGDGLTNKDGTPFAIGAHQEKITRGGSSVCPDPDCINVYIDFNLSADTRMGNVGFRLVREP